MCATALRSNIALKVMDRMFFIFFNYGFKIGNRSDILSLMLEQKNTYRVFYGTKS